MGELSPDSRWLVTGSDDMSVRVWGCRTRQAVGDPLLGHAHLVWSLCMDGHFIISGSEDPHLGSHFSHTNWVADRCW